MTPDEYRAAWRDLAADIRDQLQVIRADAYEISRTKSVLGRSIDRAAHRIESMIVRGDGLVSELAASDPPEA